MTTIEEWDDRIVGLKAQLREAQEKRSAAIMAAFGLEAGLTRLRVTQGSARGKIGVFSGLHGADAHMSPRGKPWAHVRLLKLDGTPGATERCVYTDWEVVEA